MKKSHSVSQSEWIAIALAVALMVVPLLPFLQGGS
jgi:hypothetical protein